VNVPPGDDATWLIVRLNGARATSARHWTDLGRGEADRSRRLGGAGRSSPARDQAGRARHRASQRRRITPKPPGDVIERAGPRALRIFSWRELGDAARFLLLSEGRRSEPGGLRCCAWSIVISTRGCDRLLDDRSGRDRRSEMSSTTLAADRIERAMRGAAVVNNDMPPSFSRS
jgi:hypothetical protein